MEAIYFGGAGAAHAGSGSGPWIMADLENGLFGGQSKTQKNEDNPSHSKRFITAVVKGRPNHWTLRGGDATHGTLSTYYNGVRPSGYTKMHEEGAIVLGIGGDNNHRGQGTFYEGVMVSGFPSKATENSVQSNIVSARYAVTALNTGAMLKLTSTIVFRVTTPGAFGTHLVHDGFNVKIEKITESSNTREKQSAKWTVREGFGDKQCFSFESVDTPGHFIRQANWKLVLNKYDGSKQFGEDATFCTQTAFNGKGDSIRSWAYPTRYIRHYRAHGYLASQGGPNAFDAAAYYGNDASFEIKPATSDD